MSKRPQDRYDGGTELAEDLNRFLATEPVKARRIGPAGRAWRFVRRHPSLSGVSAAAVASILAVATVAYIRVLHERNEAVAANQAKEKALGEAEDATRRMKVAMREQLLSQAQFVRITRAPDRRKKGLEVIEKAVQLQPDPVMEAHLRDEAVEFLAVRDIEPRPSLDSGKTRNLVFLPESNRLVTLAENGSEFRVWDVASGKEERKQSVRVEDDAPEDDPGPRGPYGPPPGPGVASLEGFLAVVLPRGEGVRLFQTTTGAPFADLEMPGRRISTLMATADGGRLVTISGPRGGGRGRDSGGGPGGGPGNGSRRVPEPGRVELWDPKHDEKPLADLSPTRTEPAGSAATRPPPPAWAAPIVAIGPEGRTLATAWNYDPEITLWDAQTGAKKGTITADSPPSALALGPFGVLAAACGGSVHLWDAETRRPLSGLNLHQSMIRALRFNPDGTMLAVALFNRIEIWDPASGNPLASVPTTSRVQDLSFSPDGLTLAAAVEGQVQTWAIVEPLGRTRLAPPETRPASRPAFVTFSPSGALAALFTNVETNSARFLGPRHCPSKAETWDDLKTGALAFDARGRLLIPSPGGLDVYPNFEDRVAQGRVTLPEMAPLSSNAPRWSSHYDVAGMVRSADGSTLALLRWSDVVLLKDGAPPFRLEFPQPPDPGPRRDNRDRGGPRSGPRPDPKAGEPRPQGPPPVGRRTAVLSPSGDHLYTIDSTFMMRSEPHAWAIVGDHARDLGWRKMPGDASCLALSPDGRTLAVGCRSGHVALVDTQTGTIRDWIFKREGMDKEEEGDVRAVAFSPSGDLAVGSQPGTVRLWRVSPGGRPEALVRLPGGRGPIFALAFGPDDRLAIGDDSGVALWDLASIRQKLDQMNLGW